jgi:hypothetical protein
MQFPLTVTFRFRAFAIEVRVADAGDHEVGLLRAGKRDFFAPVPVYASARVIYAIDFARWSGQHRILDAGGREMAQVSREDKSWTKARYVVALAGEGSLVLADESGAASFAEGLLGMIPLLGLLIGTGMGSSLSIERSEGAMVGRVTRRPRLLGTAYVVDLFLPVAPEEQAALLLAVMIIGVLERQRP